jgi:phosphoesterase RecJ-like protein
MVPMSIDWDRLAERIAGFQNFVLTSHIRPDCDALGSELGMAGILRQLGKNVTIVNGHPTPPGLSFLDPHESIQILG